MKFNHVFATIATLFALGLVGTPAFAQATRTWVSGVGNDANPCSRTAPCQTFAGAFSKTAAGGEIDCIDAGGFGTLMITKALSIICPAGEAGVLAGGTDGIVINAGTSDIVHLSGLDFEGLGTGLSGVNIIQAGQVRIENSTIRGFTAGVYVEPSTGSGGVNVDVIDTVIADNAGTGIRVKPTGGASVSMLVDRATVSQNMGDGIMANGTSTTGSLNVVVLNTSSEFNSHGGFVVFSGGALVQMLVDSSTAGDNVDGIAATGTGAIVRFTRSSITGNGTGVLQVSSGTALSYGTNTVNGNVNDGSFGTTPQQ